MTDFHHPQRNRRVDILARIASKTKVTDLGYTEKGIPSPCHIWQGGNSGTTGRGSGYGRMSLDGQTVATHLVVYTHYFGYIPGKRQVDHKCNNRLCCNPAHLQLVTPKQNCKMREARKKDPKKDA